MNKLIPFFDVRGKASYPDSYKHFTKMEKVSFNGADYWLCQYTGLRDLETGVDTYEDYISVNTGIRVIGVRAFFERMPKAARKKIRKSTDEDVQDVIGGMDYLNYVDLDSPITTRDLATLVTKNMLTQEVVDTKMIVDGEEYEKYNGVM